MFVFVCTQATETAAETQRRTQTQKRERDREKESLGGDSYMFANASCSNGLSAATIGRGVQGGAARSYPAPRSPNLPWRGYSWQGAAARVSGGAAEDQGTNFPVLLAF